MLKKLVLAAVVLVGGFVAYNVVTTGQLPFVSSSNLSPEEQQLAALEQRLRSAGAKLSQAMRSAGLSGMDMTADADAALEEIERVERELRDLKRRAKSDSIGSRIDRLLSEARLMKGER